MAVIITSSGPPDGLPPYDRKLRCRVHPDYPAKDGFGLAGGGYGVYSYCAICGRILSKSQEPTEPQPEGS